MCVFIFYLRTVWPLDAHKIAKFIVSIVHTASVSGVGFLNMPVYVIKEADTISVRGSNRDKLPILRFRFVLAVRKRTNIVVYISPSVEIWPHSIDSTYRKALDIV